MGKEDKTQKVWKVLAGSPDKPLKIGGAKMECYVLENGMRVLSGRGMQRALNMPSSGGQKIAQFLDRTHIKPFIDADLTAAMNERIKFRRPHKRGASEAYAYEASILKKICDVILKARRSSALKTKKETSMAIQAEILLSAFADIGIVALVDEVTGYKKRKDEYQKLLKQYIAEEIRPWIKTFDDNFYKQLYRLQGWDWDAFKQSKKTHPSYIGKLTNRLVYEKLAPGVLEALDKINPKNVKGHRSARHHQHLSENFGFIHLIKHIASVTMIMEQVKDGDLPEAIRKIDDRFPTQRVGYPIALDFPISDRKKFKSTLNKTCQPPLTKSEKRS